MSFKFVSPLVSLKRTNDVFSKHILSRKEHKAFLIDLLNAVIFDKGRHPEDEKILDVFLEDRVLSPRHDEDKIGILDIRARTRKRIYTIEIQQYVEKDIGARAYYYAAKVLGSEITRGIPYHKLTPVIIINFLTHNHLSTKNYHSCYHFNEDDEHSRLSDIVTFHFVEFPKMQKKEHGVMTRLEKWVTYLGAKAPAGEVITPEDDIFKELAEVEKVFSKDKEEMLRYEAAERYEMDYVSHMSTAELKGEERGIKKGLEKGRKAQALETAKTLLKMNLSVDKIAEATGLKTEEILQLNIS